MRKGQGEMKRILVATALLMTATVAGHAATIVNTGSDPVVVIVTENGVRSDLTVGPAESVEFCLTGCFATFPNGDRQALTGSETIEVTPNGVLVR